MNIAQISTLKELHTEMRTCRLCMDADFDVTPPAVVAGSLSARVAGRCIEVEHA